MANRNSPRYFALIAALALLGGCSGSSSPGSAASASDPRGPTRETGTASSVDSGLHARVLFGPTCPVQRVGQSCVRPYQATISILREPTNKAVATARSASDGRFSVRLTPGRYLLEPHAGRPFPRSRPQTVTVYADRFTNVTINYDSGIR
jgi:hypothetical protein